MRTALRLLLLALLPACTPPAPVADVPCGATAHRYAPFESEELELFPDPLHTVEDRGSPTGLRLSVDPSRAPWVEDLPELMRGLVDALPTATGFGRLGAMVLRFTDDFGELPDGTLPDQPLRIVDLGDGVPVDVPYTATKSEDGTQVVLQPLRPMRAGTPHALLLTREHRAADGQCVSPSPVMRGLMDGTLEEPRLRRFVPQYQNLLTQLQADPDDLVLAAPFTTNDDRDILSGVADDVATRTWGWSQDPVCSDDGESMRCEAKFIAQDYRRAGGLLQTRPWQSWEVRATIWLPKSPGPHAWAVYGHGIGGHRGEGDMLADRVARHGIAVAALDAMHHGTHPSNDAEDMDALAFLGINLDAGRLDGVQMRASFDQTTAEKLQLVELLRQHPDVDGDGAADLDPERLGYVGVSLGGLLGPSFLAHTPTRAAALPVAGGYLLKFATDMQLIAGISELFRVMLGSDEAFDRFLAVGQSAVDGSDPAVWAAHVLHDRVDGREPPHLLLPVAAQDEVVPPSTGQALARAFGLPHVAPVVEQVPLLDQVVTAPVSANLAAQWTTGFFQLGTVTNGGTSELAHHSNTPLSDEGARQWTEFLRTWAEDGTPVIIDPYAR
jgi:dienelactone hydrolase